MSAANIPLATYRLQFNRDFTFAQATRIVPYLAKLGISHCYASPYLRARPGSMHGYDIVDHNQLNPEIGTLDQFDGFVDVLHQHSMGQILDIVPNHMGVMGADNAWWLDVLENGEASNYADFFDIDWQPVKDELQGKVLVPVLDDQYGIVLDRGDLKLTFDTEKGEFSIFFHQHRFPIDPAQYPAILARGIESLSQTLGPENHDLLELQSLTAAFGHLPAQTETSAEKRAERNRDKEIHKRRLATLCAHSPQITSFIQQNVSSLNGNAGEPRSFDELHELIKTQAFRLAYWRVAADEINYRRFFDINDLAGLRMERQQVFDATHQFIGELLSAGKVDGLRVDHPDGLFDPQQYFERLQALKPQYLVIEKILSGDETLPSSWPVHGTTGYEFSNLVNGLFVDASSGAKIKRGYRGFLGEAVEVRDILFRCKKIVMRDQLSSDLNVLANFLSRIALANRHTCDFTLNSLRRALADVVANLSVYRTYVTESNISDSDRWYVETAIQRAKRRSNAQDTSVFEFIRQVLLTRNGHSGGASAETLVRFSMKCQQFTSPVMAKGLEDTSLYRYHPLMSRNDVGNDPLEFGVTVSEFHRKTERRARAWPHSMLATSTHDSKLSEDVRARIDVLSEVPGQWRLKARQWRLLNRSKKVLIEGEEIPTRNDEYLFYQILIGVWPMVADTPTDQLRDRLKTYMLKAAREAKESTSWANQNAEYETALTSFVEAVLDSKISQEFLSDFVAFQGWIAGIGVLNTLSRTVVKFTVPGVPDIYQGNELFDFSLVDPDNRRPVDYTLREQLLSEMAVLPCEKRAPYLQSILKDLFYSPDLHGRSKLFLTWMLLRARHSYAALFQEGEYVPLAVQGVKSRHLLAFARRTANESAIVVVPVLWAQLLGNETNPLTADMWANTSVEIPSDWPEAGYQNCITCQTLAIPPESSGKRAIPVASLLKDLPWVVMIARS